MKNKTIYCPDCNRKVFEYDGRGKMFQHGKCSKCKYLIVYKPIEDKIVKRDVPCRSLSSGVTFY